MPRGSTVSKARLYSQKRDTTYIKQESPQIMNLTSIYRQPTLQTLTTMTGVGTSKDFFCHQFEQTPITLEGHTPNANTASTLFPDFIDTKPILSKPQVNT